MFRPAVPQPGRKSGAAVDVTSACVTAILGNSLGSSSSLFNSKHIKTPLILEWRAHNLIFALKFALKGAKLLTKEHLQTALLKKKKRRPTNDSPLQGCSFALLVNGGLTQEAHQVRTRPLITHSNYHLTGSDSSPKQADSSLLKGFPPYQSHASSSAAICRYRVRI